MGLDPTLGAFIGLLGVVLGAFATGGLAYVMRRRDERAELRAVARALTSELEGAISRISYIVEFRRLDRLAEANVNARVWDEHHLCIARELDYDAWQAVQWAFQNGRVAEYLIGDNANDADKYEYARELRDEMKKAPEALRPFVGAHRAGQVAKSRR